MSSSIEIDIMYKYNCVMFQIVIRLIFFQIITKYTQQYYGLMKNCSLKRHSIFFIICSYNIIQLTLKHVQ